MVFAIMLLLCGAVMSVSAAFSNQLPAAGQPFPMNGNFNPTLTGSRPFAPSPFPTGMGFPPRGFPQGQGLTPTPFPQGQGIAQSGSHPFIDTLDTIGDTLRGYLAKNPAALQNLDSLAVALQRQDLNKVIEHVKPFIMQILSTGQQNARMPSMPAPFNGTPSMLNQFGNNQGQRW